MWPVGADPACGILDSIIGFIASGSCMTTAFMAPWLLSLIVSEYLACTLLCRTLYPHRPLNMPVQLYIQLTNTPLLGVIYLASAFIIVFILILLAPIAGLLYMFIMWDVRLCTEDTIQAGVYLVFFILRAILVFVPGMAGMYWAFSYLRQTHVTRFDKQLPGSETEIHRPAVSKEVNASNGDV